MKKIFAFASTIGMTMLMSAGVFATTIDQDPSTDKTADVMVQTSIAPTYTVTIPANVTVPFNAETTTFGKIIVDAAQLEPDKCIKVALTTDGELNNTKDTSKIIPYVIQSEGSAFTSATYLAAGEQTALSIHITKDDWNKAYAGTYTDTVTFEVSYIDK